MRSNSRPAPKYRPVRIPILVGVLVVASVGAACGGNNGEPVTRPVVTEPSSTSAASAPDWLIARAGSATTTFEVSERSYNLSARNVGLTARIRFADGDEVFEAFFDEATGLGHDYSAEGCTSCHVNNGRQAERVVDGPLPVGPVVHVSASESEENTVPTPLPGYGTRLQTDANQGAPEATITVRWDTIDGTYPDGTAYQLRRPTLTIAGRDGAFPSDAQISLRIPPQVAGPGLLEFVPDADLIAAADPDDRDGDGISGEIQWVPDGDTMRIGRHGWKAENADLTHQSANALADDMGISTSLRPFDTPIELSDPDLADLAFYVEALAIPAGRDIDDPDVIAGANLFETVGCADCHTPQQRTGETNTPELDDLVILPFTDLLLHDMGPGLSDGRPVLAASGREWRTAALWGVGLLEIVNGHASLLHDGRARSVEEAILWHGGEAQASNDAFQALDRSDRAKLLRFVQSR